MFPEVRERAACMAAASGRGRERAPEQERVLQGGPGRELRREPEDALGLPGPGQARRTELILIYFLIASVISVCGRCERAEIISTPDGVNRASSPSRISEILKTDSAGPIS